MASKSIRIKETMHSHQSRLQPPTSKPYLCQMNWPKHLCFLLFCCTTFVGWSTDIPAGNVSGVWTAANSPYVVQGNLRVPAGESLTIEAGVEVQFAANYFVRVLGNFQALGAAGDSVLLHIQIREDIGTGSSSTAWTPPQIPRVSAIVFSPP
jgi:hypothetical protein